MADLKSVLERLRLWRRFRRTEREILALRELQGGALNVQSEVELRPPVPPLGQWGKVPGFPEQDFTTLPSLGLSKLEVASCIERDPYPIPAPEDREDYHGSSHYDYWLSGLEDFRRLEEALKSHGLELQRGTRLLDFGSASGRVVRHFACQEQGLEIYAAECNANHVRWIQRHLPDSIYAFTTGIAPPLPLGDASLDLLFAYSVFTHIDDFEEAWLLDLHRVLRPGGIAMLTIHGERLWRELTGDHPLLRDHLMTCNPHPQLGRVTEELFRKPMPAPTVTFTFGMRSALDTQKFHSDEHIHGKWGRLFDVLEIRPGFSGFQDAVFLRKVERIQEQERSLHLARERARPRERDVLVPFTSPRR